MSFPAYPRSGKACETVEVAPSLQSKSPLAGHQDFAANGLIQPGDGGTPVSPSGREDGRERSLHRRASAAKGTRRQSAGPYDRDANQASPAGDREEPALFSHDAFMADPGAAVRSAMEHGRATILDRASRPSLTIAGQQEDPTIPAEVARRAGLSPMLLAAAFQDVMARRAGG